MIQRGKRYREKKYSRTENLQAIRDIVAKSGHRRTKTLLAVIDREIARTQRKNEYAKGRTHRGRSIERDAITDIVYSCIDMQFKDIKQIVAEANQKNPKKEITPGMVNYRMGRMVKEGKVDCLRTRTGKEDNFIKLYALPLAETQNLEEDTNINIDPYYIDPNRTF